MSLQTIAFKVVKYHNSTSEYVMVLKPSSSTKLTVHTDANWASQLEAEYRF